MTDRPTLVPAPPRPNRPNGWVGTTLDNGAIIIALTWVREHSATDCEGVALAYWKSSPDPYVTWSVSPRSTPTRGPVLEAYSGHYFDSVVEAAEDYRKRGGR